MCATGQPMALMLLFRRLVLLVSIAFWQGGFMFYGGVVVTVGARVLGSELEQGFITQSVTNCLNVAGVVCVSLWGLSLWFEAPKARWEGRLSWGLWWAIVAMLVVLVGLHPLMDGSLDSGNRSVLDETRFDWMHGVYIATSTAQWLASLALLGLTLRAWQTADGHASVKPN